LTVIPTSGMWSGMTIFDRISLFLGGAAHSVAMGGVVAGAPKWLVIACLAVSGGALAVSPSIRGALTAKAPPP
jgi:hypothetical protein